MFSLFKTRNKILLFWGLMDLLALGIQAYNNR